MKRIIMSLTLALSVITMASCSSITNEGAADDTVAKEEMVKEVIAEKTVEEEKEAIVAEKEVKDLIQPYSFGGISPGQFEKDIKKMGYTTKRNVVEMVPEGTPEDIKVIEIYNDKNEKMAIAYTYRGNFEKEGVSTIDILYKGALNKDGLGIGQSLKEFTKNHKNYRTYQNEHSGETHLRTKDFKGYHFYFDEKAYKGPNDIDLSYKITAIKLCSWCEFEVEEKTYSD